MVERRTCGKRADDGCQSEMEMDQAYSFRLQAAPGLHTQLQRHTREPVEASGHFCGAPGQLTVGPPSQPYTGNRDPIAPQPDVNTVLFAMEELRSALRKAANKKLQVWMTSPQRFGNG